MGHHALVFGASGILGWAVVNQILENYPKQGVFSKVTALANRPLTRETAFWPSPGPDVPALHLVDGIDLTKGTPDDLKEVFKQRIPDVETVTHVYYFAYAQNHDFRTESDINLGMLKRGFGAVETLAPNLEYVILPTGSKKYGMHLPERPFEAPYREEMSNIPQPWHDDLFYYVLHRELDHMQKGKSWKFAEVACGVVTGFVPHQNAYNVPAMLMNFLSLYKFMHETGHPAAASKEVPFPGPPASYPPVYNDGGQDIFARFSIHLSLHPDAAGNSELYNIADTAQPCSFAERWPFFCSLYGLVGVPPAADKPWRPVGFVTEHAGEVERLARERGVELQGIGLSLDLFLDFLTFNHHVALDKARAVGFQDESSVQQTWGTMLDRYVRAGKAYRGA
ncbi:hypothetical protein F4779DRAFT_342965 [Xylariaceae sp. FL0662B]|nr:hypothetical protein F4779DRAFT_342965 [Xylariaceae sp. FL0662B]